MTLLGSEHGYLEVEPHNPSQRREDREVILLLHGLGGNKSDWSYPKWRPQHWDHRVDPSPKKNNNQLIPPYFPWPISYTDRIGLSKKRTWARCWRGILLSQEHTVINYSQDGNQDEVGVPLNQFENSIVPFIKDEVLVNQLANKKVVVLCHSRGGILARSYLNSRQDVDWISHIITLCTPHRGTLAPNAVSKLAQEASIIAAVSNFSFSLLPIGVAVARTLSVFDESAGAKQLLPESELINDLPMPIDFPSLTFSTFGGTSPAYSGIFHYIYDVQSYFPNFWDFPDVRFDWNAEPIEIPALSPLFNSIPDGLVDDEQKDGMGDGLVSDHSASLPGADHISLPMNHIEALYDETLFQHVMNLLGTPLNGTEQFECFTPLIGNTRTRQLHNTKNEHPNCQLDEIQEPIAFDQLDSALSEGYDGCYYCMPEHHTT